MSLAEQVLEAAEAEAKLKPKTKVSLLRTVTDPYALTAGELSRIVASRVRVKAADRTDYEQDALAQVVTVSLLPGQRRGTASEVLAWIDWADRNPASAARAERIPRGTVGRTLIDQRISRIKSESREWRDTCDDYRTRIRADREKARVESAAVIAADFSEPIDEDESPSVAYLAMADEAIRRGEADRAPIGLDADHLAATVAANVGATPSQARAIYAAILRISAEVPAPKSGGEKTEKRISPATVALGMLAAAEGRSLKSVQNDAANGLKLLAGLTWDQLRTAIAAAAITEDPDPFVPAPVPMIPDPLAGPDYPEISPADRTAILAVTVRSPARPEGSGEPVREGRTVTYPEMFKYPTANEFGALTWGMREKLPSDEPDAGVEDYVPALTLTELEAILAGKTGDRVR